MNNPICPFTAEKVLKFFEELSGQQFIDVETKRPVLELIEESKEKRPKPSGYEEWLAEQDLETKLAHRMGAI